MNRFDAEEVESARSELQATLDAAKPHDLRNRLGQFATPPQLAEQITKVALHYLAAVDNISFLDPAFGTGAFYSALLRAENSPKLSCALGFEVDPHYLAPTSRLWANSPLLLKHTDFFEATPSPSTKPVDLIICNPPYVRHHHIGTARKALLRRQISDEVGLRLSGLAGLYAYFMLHAHHWLKPNAIAAWLVPGEFLDVNYGLVVKQYLSSQVELLRIHRFDPQDVQFGDALVSSVVVWFRSAGPTSDHFCEFTHGGDLTSPHHRRTVRSSDLMASARWSSLFDAVDSVQAAGPPLGDLFRIVRGVATGANEFFVLSQRTRQQLDVPPRFLRPLLPPPRRLKELEIMASPDGEPLLGEQLFLLAVDVPVETFEAKHPSLAQYLITGAQEYSARYLCRSRDPWYTQEYRDPAPLLCTYMGRVGTRGTPFRFIVNRSRAIATNVYLMLYPRAPLARLLESDTSLLPRIRDLLDRIATDQFVRTSRVYGGGLHKFEPRELAALPVGALHKVLPKEILMQKAQRELF